ncbi:MAG: DUF4238 domain-containing protein [Actinomycetota bacterium]|nr:DUF4238 domain-containing protein [Actinomycetota bacterium]
MATGRQRNRKSSRRAHHAGRRTAVPLFEHLLDILEGRRSMPGSDAKYQHYVPQLHLRGFSSNPRPARNAFIWRLDKHTGAIEQKRVARVGGEKHFNRVKGTDNKYTNVLEAWLNIVEHHAAPALERLTSSLARLSYADRITLAFYLAIQESRTPRGLANVESAGDMVFDAHVELWTHDRAMFDDICHEAGIEDTPEAVEQARALMREPDSFQMADVRTQAFRTAISITGELTNVISPMTWTVLASAKPLVVGDHPVTHHDAEPTRFPWTEPTWRSSPTAESYFPLNSGMLLKMNHPRHRKEPDFATATMSVQDTGEMNLRSYGWATRYVFAEDRETLEGVHAQAHTQPEAVPRASRQFQVITADERAFRTSERNEQPPGWPSHVLRVGQSGEIEKCRYKVVPHDRPDEMRAGVSWMLKAERRLHPGARPSLEMGSREDYAAMHG